MEGSKLKITIAIFLALGIIPAAIVAPAQAETMNFSVTIQPHLSLTVSNNALAINNLLPNNTGESSEIDINVKTNNSTGYTLFATVGNEAYNTTSLTNSATDNAFDSIATTDSLAKADLPSSSWAYSIDSGTTYSGLPLYTAEAKVLSDSDTPTNGNITPLRIAANAAVNMASGNYENVITFSLVPNYVPLSLSEAYSIAGKTRVMASDGNEYYSMQDMSPEICNATDKVESTLQVADARDGKVYWITKLKDGNCWMTQNLDYDLSVVVNQALTPATSDVAENRTVTPVAWNEDQDSIYYMDGGDDYYVDGITKTAGYSSLLANSIDRHYAAGDYYSWKAATAGQGTASITRTDVAESICPKGWRLPTSDSADVNYGFGNLIKQYGYTGYDQYSNTSDAALLAAPLFFARGGAIYSAGSPSSQGDRGIYWSSKAYSYTDAAHYLYFNNDSVAPSTYGGRNAGFSVRCVAHGNTLTLSYNANGGTNAPSASVAESNSTSATITISSTIPTREHYNFLGWATSSTATAPDYVYSNGSFTPSIITVTGNQTLYAVWEGPIYYNMQDVLDWMDDLELEQQVQVVDSRDNKIYWVAKLKDGNIWMTQNLDYDIVAGDNIISNNDGTTSIWNTSSTYAPQATTTSVFNSTSYTDTYSYDPGSNYLPNGTSTPTAITCTSTSNDGENCHYHQGNYYQYNAATAGTGGTITNTDAASSICPKGWRLPTSNSTDANYSFGNLVKQYGYSGANQSSGVTDSTLLASPLFFARGGRVYSGSLNIQDSDGYYWSSRASFNSGFAYNLHFYGSRVYPSNNYYRNYGHSVRCVAIDPTLNGISTMQEMTPAIVAATPENTSKQLMDTRDNKLYWVTKLADGNIWMTQNLDYDIKAGDNIVSNLDGTTSIWNTSSTYAPQATTTTVFNNSSNTGTYSYDPGSNYIPNGTGTPTAITCTSTTNGGENCHSHQGNYYQYNAATAGTGGTITNADATSSICPKGWRLPTSNSDSANYSFGNLVKQYGYTGSNQSSTSDAILLASPLFFARGGYVYSGSLNDQGSYGYYWSSRAGSDTNYAYRLIFSSGYVIPSYNYIRYNGCSVRCVAL